jgi:hypothetical protein
MSLYKNITNQELIIPNIGVVAPNDTIETELEIVNSNLILITNSIASAQSAPAPAEVLSVPTALELTTEEN